MIGKVGHQTKILEQILPTAFGWDSRNRLISFIFGSPRRGARPPLSMAAAGRAPAASASYHSSPRPPYALGGVHPAPAWRRARCSQGRYAPRKRGGLRPSLTAAARDPLELSGRDEEPPFGGQTMKQPRWCEPYPQARVRWPHPTPNSEEANI